MSAFPWKLVTVDIDGTLTTVHGWRRIAEATGRTAAYRASNEAFFSRRTSEDAHLGSLLSLAEGLTITEVESLLDSTPKLQGIAEGVASLHRFGARVALLTHNPEYVGRWYLRTFGFDDFEGCSTPPLHDGHIPAPGPVRADKRTGLRRLLARAGTAPGRTAHLGDGWADIPVFLWTGGGVAINPERREVEEAADAVVRSNDFRAIVRVLEGLVPRPPVNDVLGPDEPLNS